MSSHFPHCNWLWNDAASFFLISTCNILYNIDIILHLHSDHNLVLYILITIWVLRTPNVGQNMLFQCFCSKSWKKKEARKLMQNKKKFELAPKRWLRALLPEKNTFVLVKRCFYLVKRIQNVAELWFFVFYAKILVLGQFFIIKLIKRGLKTRLQFLGDKLFDMRTSFHHLNTGRVLYLDPHCKLVDKLTFNI